MFWVAGREEEAMLWLLSVSEMGWLQSVYRVLPVYLSQPTKSFSEVSDWFAQPLPQPWLNSQGRHAHHAPLGSRRHIGTPFDGTPFDGLGTPFDGTPFDRLGTPFEGATF
ncbi:hypothetical protein GCM10023322_84310 [Rugosimonospora acidiphila]|uniref:Uncharacterized protein n=1 Tax=Rugosimonospora acidiphila TaxID=556531 RepID=A0ABP9SUF0_9ACTN